MDERWLKVNDHLSLPLDELSFRFSRAGGPGGQNVNRTASRVELLFDVANSPSLSEEQRLLLLRRLRRYLDAEGVLHLVADTTPSQWRNRQEVIVRLHDLLRESLRPQYPRIATRATRASQERRLQHKRRRSQIKEQRGAVRGEE